MEGLFGAFRLESDALYLRRTFQAIEVPSHGVDWQMEFKEPSQAVDHYSLPLLSNDCMSSCRGDGVKGESSECDRNIGIGSATSSRMYSVVEIWI